MKQFKQHFLLSLISLFLFVPSILNSQTPVILNGFPHTCDTMRTTAYMPMITDLDNDRHKEIIVWQNAGRILKEISSLSVIKSDGLDYPAFPKYFTDFIQEIASGDVNNDGYIDIVIRFDSTINVIDRFGNSLSGFPVEYIDRTDYYMSKSFSLNIYDLDNNGDLEIITNMSDELIVFNSNGMVRQGWPQRITADPYFWSAAIGDVDNDTYAEIFLTCIQSERIKSNSSENNVRDKISRYNMDRSKSSGIPAVLYSAIDAFRHNGARLSGEWPAVNDSSYHTWGASPSLYINSKYPDSSFLIVPTYIDLPDNLGLNRLTMYNISGGILKRTFFQNEYSAFGTFAIADLNKDGRKEFISGSAEETVTAFDMNLDIVEGWPRPGMGQHESSVIIGKLAEGTGLNVMTNEWYLNPLQHYRGYLYAYDNNGNNLSWSPLRPHGIVMSTACADLNNDGSVEIVASTYFQHYTEDFIRAMIHAWTIPGIPFTHADFPWPQMNHDRYRSNQYGFIPDDELVGVNSISNNIPGKFLLYQNYPNPFNPNTTIRFDITKEAQHSSQNVRLVVYDALGKELTTLVNERLAPGSYEAVLDGTNFSSGIYFYKLEAGNFVETKRMILLK